MERIPNYLFVMINIYWKKNFKVQIIDLKVTISIYIYLIFLNPYYYLINKNMIKCYHGKLNDLNN